VLLRYLELELEFGVFQMLGWGSVSGKRDIRLFCFGGGIGGDGLRVFLSTSTHLIHWWMDGCGQIKCVCGVWMDGWLNG
jgi:hypothetical protein